MKRDVQTKVLEMKNLDLSGTQWRIQSPGSLGIQLLPPSLPLLIFPGSLPIPRSSPHFSFLPLPLPAAKQPQIKLGDLGERCKLP